MLNNVQRRLLSASALTGVCMVAAGTLATGSARAAAASGGSAPSVLGEVIVTAMRREQALQDVPVTVTALSAQEVKEERVHDFRDVMGRTPGTVFVPLKGSTYATPQIRGQVTTNESGALDGPVAFFIDDIYYGSAASFNSDFYDISQIAVLKGPQGTTFGRNVVGGAIQVTSQRPQFDNSGEVSVTAGNYMRLESTGFANLELNPNLAARVSYSIRKRDGFSHNVFTGIDIDDENVRSTRLQVRYRPTEDFDINLMVSNTFQDQYGDAPRFVGPSAVAVVARQNAAAPNIRDVYVNDNGQNKRNIWQATLHADWTTPIGTFSSITGFHSLHGSFHDDVDVRPEIVYGSPYSYNINQENLYSQEFRLVSPAKQKLDYVIGFYADKQDIYKLLDLSFNGPNIAGLPGGACSATTNPDGNFFFDCAIPANYKAAATLADYRQGVYVTSLAPYAEFNYHLTDQLSLTVGGRYTWTKKKGYTIHDGASPFYGAAFHVDFDHNWKSFTPRAIINFKPTPDILVYGSVAKGFKSGGYSATMSTAAQSSVPLAPEKNTSFEVGLKSQFLEHRATFNVSAYKSNTKNLQVKTLQNGAFVEQNAGEAEVKGIEVDTAVRPVDEFTLGIRYAYTNAQYKSFKGCTSGGFDCSGQHLPYTPKNDLLVYAEYDLHLPQPNATIALKADVKFASKYPLSAVNSDVAFAKQLTGQKGVLGLSAIYKPDNQPWMVQVWAKNVTNKLYAPFGSNYYFFAMTNREALATAQGGLGLARDVDRVIFAPPRTFGVTATYDF